MKNKILKNKKLLIVGSVLILIILFIIFLVINKTTNSKSINIVKSESNEIKLVNYENNEITMKIPEGWKVETGGTDMFYALKVYNPKDTRYQIFAILKAQPFLKNNKAKSWYQYYYNTFKHVQDRVLADAIVLSNPSVNDFYSNFNDYAKYAKSIEPSYTNFNFPDLKNFVALESFESNSSLKKVSKDDKTLRGTFQTQEGKNGEGLFMASVIDIGSNMTLGYDTYFYMIYNIMGITTAKYDLVNYKDILVKSLNSLVYKDSFTSATIRNGNEQTKNALAINKTISEAYDSYNNAWTARQKTYDITSQKYSDTTLGYIRVYDTETSETYKAYNGFLDDYKGERYKEATDDMYTKSISGYIEK